MAGMPKRRGLAQQERFADLREKQEVEAIRSSHTALSKTAQSEVEPQASYLPGGPVAYTLRKALQALVDPKQQARRLLAFCEPPGPDATAADRRVALDANIYVTNQLIGAPRQAVDITSDERRTIVLSWGQATEALSDALSNAIEAEATVVEDAAAPGDGDNGQELT